MELEEQYRRAADAIAAADALLIGAGAGMVVDSGLPDFRGTEGFWKAYPPFRGRHFSEMSTPHWFRSDPQLAWGFFGHRLNLYRSAIPHPGFQILQKWAKKRPDGCFVFTSNVDGQFRKSGFSPEDVVECHGSIHHLQCSSPCHKGIWEADAPVFEIDLETIRTTSPLPQCPQCGDVARPNILMFGDPHWIATRSDRQHKRYLDWLERTPSRRLVIVELGAGLAVPTVRYECQTQPGTLIRINPREAEVGRDGISLPVGALAALRAIDDLLEAGKGREIASGRRTSPQPPFEQQG